jgi:hypothetical protein
MKAWSPQGQRSQSDLKEEIIILNDKVKWQVKVYYLNNKEKWQNQEGIKYWRTFYLWKVVNPKIRKIG